MTDKRKANRKAAKFFWHISAASNRPQIMREGLRPPVFVVTDSRWRHTLARDVAMAGGGADDDETFDLYRIRKSAIPRHTLTADDCTEFYQNFSFISGVGVAKADILSIERFVFDEDGIITLSSIRPGALVPVREAYPPGMLDVIKPMVESRDRMARNRGKDVDTGRKLFGRFRNVDVARVTDVVVAAVGHGMPAGVPHPAMYPQNLADQLVRTYSRPDDLVADPCCGSGTTLVAARDAGRRYWGNDIHRPYVELARRRLRAS